MMVDTGIVNNQIEMWNANCLPAGEAESEKEEDRNILEQIEED